MQGRSSRPAGVMSVVFAEVLTAILLLATGFLLIDAALVGLVGAGTLFTSGMVGILLSLLSAATAGGLRMGKGWSWTLTRILSIITIVLSAGLIALAATITGTLLYPGLAIVLLILLNDTIIAELAVAYLLTKPDVRAYLGKKAPLNP